MCVIYERHKNTVLFLYIHAVEAVATFHFWLHNSVPQNDCLNAKFYINFAHYTMYNSTSFFQLHMQLFLIIITDKHYNTIKQINNYNCR